ncbi:TPA: hypothetical protein ACFAT2_002004, partial [Neisseria gonorrhoeae]|uniref:hypothetical protein n=1 Tax=Neisseria gonorrhoeae TaxID=485 RepID=UPI001E2A3D9B
EYLNRHSHESGNLETPTQRESIGETETRQTRMHACAGMTGFGITVLSGGMGNGEICVKNAV